MDVIEISVIIPVYNVEPFLEDCLLSVLKQTIGLDRIEVILVDDGSTDGSGKIAIHYAKKHDHFSYMYQNNAGLSAARNAGLEAAKGKYIVFLDSDDRLKPHALETLYLKAVTDNVDLVLFGAESFNEMEETENKPVELVAYKNNHDSVSEGYKLYQKMYFCNDLIISACWVMAAKNLINRFHIRFIEGIQYEDHWYNFLLFLYAQRVIVVNIPLYERRVRNGSIMAENNYGKKFQGMFHTLLKLDELRRNNALLQGQKNDVDLEMIRISAHILNALVQIEYSENDMEQLRMFQSILRKSQYWRKACLTVTALLGVKAGIWFRMHIGK